MMDWFDNNISDEMLAAYIEGNATPMESAFISDTMMHDDLLAEAIDIVNDSLSMGNGLFGDNDIFNSGMNNSFEDWFPNNGMDSVSPMPDVFDALDGNDGLSSLSDENDFMNNNFDLTNNEY